MSKKPENARKPASTQILTLPIGEIRPYEKNPRKNENAVKYVKESIRQFGFKVPIVIDSNRVIVCGHTRLLAAKSLGLTEVPCIMADDLTDDQIKAFRLADNKVGEFAEWDMDMLGDELDAIADACDIDMGDFGFDLSDDEETEIVEDEVPEEVEPVCKKGEVWQLGEHRLMCGDSTDKENIKKLMDGNRADITFSSPPYNMLQNGSVAASAEKYKTINNTYKIDKGTYDEFTDALSNEEYSQLLCSTLENGLENSDDVMFNIGILSGSKFGIIDMMHKFQKNFCDIIVWNKKNSIPLGTPTSAGLVSHRCELIFCFNQKGTRAFSHPQWKNTKFKGEMMINRIDTGNCSNNEFSKIHHATFPVEFASKVIEMYSAESVIDLFGGVGTTLIAAEQIGRKCYMMELSPQYCDVIIARWEKFTGQKAVKIEG